VSDLRHHCFQETEIPEVQDTWVHLGVYGAVMVWERDGLQRVAQWSATMGLHVFTEGMHRGCLRLVCPWQTAKIIVDNIRRGTVELRMKKNEETVAKLIDAAEKAGGLAVVVVGDYGCGKVEMCRQAIKKMSGEPHIVQLDMLDDMDISGLPILEKPGERTQTILDRIPGDAGLVLDGLHSVAPIMLPMVAMALTKLVRASDKRRPAVFITIPPNTAGRDVEWRLREVCALITGESLGGERFTVQVPK
jgi:hypothetical protein